MTKSKVTSDVISNEYKAKLESGLTDEQWFGLTREERAARVAYIYGRDMVNGLAEFDAIEESKKKRK